MNSYYDGWIENSSIEDNPYVEDYYFSFEACREFEKNLSEFLDFS